jgi:hypothetical protein
MLAELRDQVHQRNTLPADSVLSEKVFVYWAEVLFVW